MSILQTYQAAVGPKAGSTLTLPPLEDSYITLAYPDRTLSAASETQNESGSWLFFGANPFAVAYGEIQFTYIITPAYLINYPSVGSPYGATWGGLEWALTDFQQYCVDGGLGTLTDPVLTGAKAWVSAAYQTYTQRTCTAIIRNQPKIERLSGAPIAKITGTWMCPAARWTLNTATATTVPFP